MKKIRTIFYAASIISAIFAGYLSFQVDEDSNTQAEYNVTISIDSAKDGGAAGFAVLSGLALIATAITYLKKDEN